MKKLHRKWYFFYLYFLFSFFPHLPDLLLLPIIIVIIIITIMGTKKQQRWAKRLNLATVVRNVFVLQTTTGADGEEFWEWEETKERQKSWEELFTRVDERCYCVIIPRLWRVDITAAAAGKEKTPTKHSDTEKDRGTEERGFWKRGKSSERRKVYLVWEAAFGFVGFMIRLQAVRASERAASDGEFWVFFFVPYLFFFFSETSSFLSWRRGASAAAAEVWPQLTHSLVYG